MQVKPELRAKPVDPAYGRADQHEIAGSTLNTAEFRQYGQIKNKESGGVPPHPRFLYFISWPPVTLIAWPVM